MNHLEENINYFEHMVKQVPKFMLYPWCSAAVVSWAIHGHAQYQHMQLLGSASLGHFIFSVVSQGLDFYYMQLQHDLYEETGQAVSSINLIIDFWVWFPINFIFLIPQEAKITDSHMVLHKQQLKVIFWFLGTKKSP